MWFGTPNGLNRYDGQNITVFASRSGFNIINKVFEGPDKNLWLNTDNGLLVFDLEHYKFIQNPLSILTRFGLPEGLFLDIKKDSNGSYWLLHTNGNLYRCSKQKEKNITYKKNLKGFPVTGISQVLENSMWIIYQNGKLERIDTKSMKALESRQFPFSHSQLSVFSDQNKQPWIYSSNTANGVYFWPTSNSNPIHFSTSNPNYRIKNNMVMGLCQDDKKNVWIATDNGGLSIYKPTSDEIVYLEQQDGNNRSLSHNAISSLYADSDGGVWIGTFKAGVNFFHQNKVLFPFVHHIPNVKSSLPYDDVNCFLEDKKGNLWIGSNGGGLIFYDKAKQQYKQYLHSNSDPSSIGSNVVVSLFLDKEETLWIGTYHGGLNRFANGRFTKYLSKKGGKTTISDDSVWEIFEDSKGRFWIGTLSGGINLFNKQNGIFSKPGKSFIGPSNTYICAIKEDKNGNIWFGTADGLDVLSPNNNLKHFNKAANGLANNYISGILEDLRGQIWLATKGGISIFKNGRFQNLGVNNGLADNNILTILEDELGAIWVSTSRGVSKINVDGEKIRIQNFSKEDGLQASPFNENAALKLRSGNLIFGGLSGYNVINPKKNITSANIPKPTLTGFKLFNKTVNIGEKINGKVILNQAIHHQKTISLNHNQNVLSLEISPLYYINSKSVRIKYRLEGLSKDWLDLDQKSHLANFTNLSFGNYDFQVISSLDGENWSKPISLIQINIAPPFWLSWWAFFLYALLIYTVFRIARQTQRKRTEAEEVIKKEREEARKTKEIDELKTTFFTNISHEFKTPLSLIISPIEDLAATETDLRKKSNLLMVQRNAKRLVNLLNQLLDFRKVDTKSLKVYLKEDDLMASLAEHSSSFEDLAEKKKIDYQIEISPQSLICLFDAEKVERIVFNILSNAFKFTPLGGKISFRAIFDTESKHLSLSISDNGVGIPEEEKNKIFDRFFQSKSLESILNQGSGIGLSMVNEYVNIMDGKMAVESEINKGTTFRIILPVIEKQDHQNQTESSTPIKDYKILLVEDDDEFRLYLAESLIPKYKVDQAANFKEGWSKTLSFHPDLIVSDVSMPDKSGVELLKKIKSDSRTSHIPVILLTGLSSVEQQLEGVEAGAADYITKPFNSDLLLSKIKSQLKQKSTFEKVYKKQLSITPTEMKEETKDEKFLRKMVQQIEKNLENSSFSVEDLADFLNLTRVGLYKKSLTLTGFTPSEYIKKIRLEKAATLLEDNSITIAEVSYRVGFGNPKAFAKYFRKIHGKSPSEFKKMLK